MFEVVEGNQVGFNVILNSFVSRGFFHFSTPTMSLEKLSAMVERQNEDEDEAGDGRECQKYPEKNKVNLLSQKFPVSKGLVDRIILFLLLGHLVVKMLLSISFLNMGQSRPLLRLFSSFSHSNTTYNCNTNWKKCRWDLNREPQDGRRRQNHRAMAAIFKYQ